MRNVGWEAWALFGFAVYGASALGRDWCYLVETKIRPWVMNRIVTRDWPWSRR